MVSLGYVPTRECQDHDMHTLNQLKPGESGIIKNVGGFGARRRRLLEMGLTPGTRIMVQKMAPSGDPIEIHIRGYQLTLRRDDARQIELMEEGA